MFPSASPDRCRLCGAPEPQPFAVGLERAGQHYAVLRCRACGNGQTEPFPTLPALAALYETGSYRSADGTRFHPLVERLVSWCMGGRVRRLTADYPAGDLLDIGCGRGAFLASMRAAGWQVTGAEFSEETAGYARQVHNVPVVSDLAALPAASFDLITLNHVLEHLPEPRETVRRCHQLLRPGGHLVVAVPNLASLQATFGKGAWLHLDVPCHLFHFSTAGLTALLTDEGFAPEQVRQFDLEQGGFGWLQTLLNRLGGRPNFLYSLLKQPELRRRELASARVGMLLQTVLLAPLLAPVALLLALLEGVMLRRGGAVEVRARRLD